MSVESVRAGLAWVPEDHLQDPPCDRGEWVKAHQEAELERRIGGELHNWLGEVSQMTDLEKARKHIQGAWAHIVGARWDLKKAITLAGTDPAMRDMAQPLHAMMRQLDEMEQRHVALFGANSAELERRVA